MPTISVVIPCYNSAAFLPEAIGSVEEAVANGICEVIVVDDGSTDEETLVLLQTLQNRGHTVLKQSNKGPAAARNTGVAYSEKEFILFLDSDNKLRPDYINKALYAMHEDSNIGVVYGSAFFFGDDDVPRFAGKPFNFSQLIQGNYIDMCSLVRREVWEEVGGLDEARVLIGHEDWDFWIRIAETKWKFYFIDEVLFDYRIRVDSLIKQATLADKYDNMLRYFYSKHWRILQQDHKRLVEQYNYYVFDQHRPFRSFVKYLRNSLSAK